MGIPNVQFNPFNSTQKTLNFNPSQNGGQQGGGGNANPINFGAFTPSTQGVGGVQGTSGALGAVKSAGASFQGVSLNSELFQSNYGKGLAPANYAQNVYMGSYNGKENYCNQIGIA